jgi:hypothetical protein
MKFRHDRRAAGSMNGSVDPAASRESRIRRVADGFKILGRDVSLHQFDARLSNRHRVPIHDRLN